jgi:tetratricopeptide (TPR) repeat protein
MIGTEVKPVGPPRSAVNAWALMWIDAHPEEPPLPRGLLAWPWHDVATELRRECYRAWTTAPGEAQVIAQTLARVGVLARDPEVDAQAVWVHGIASLARGQPHLALDELQRAEVALRAQGRHAEADDTRLPQMVCLAMLDRHAEAVSCGRWALDAFHARGDEFSAGKVEQNLGSILLRQDRYADAAIHFRRAALHFAWAGDHAHSIMADNGLASVLTAQFRFAEALQMAERARQRAQSRGLVPLLATIHNVLGRLELLRGRLGAAMHWLALVLRDADRGASPSSVAEAQRTLADAYRAANLLPESVALYDRTVESARLRKAPVEEAWALVQRAWVQARMEQRPCAREDLGHARHIFQLQGNTVGMAVVRLHEAALSLHERQFILARELAAQAAAGFSQGGLHSGQLEAQVLQAQIDEQSGEFDAATRQYEATLRNAQDLPQVMAPCAQGLGRLAWMRADVSGARGWFGMAQEQYERQRQTLVGDELRTAFADNTQAVHDALVELAMARRAEDGPWPLLGAIESGRARALHHGLQDDAGLEAGDEDVQLQSLRTRLTWLQGQWQQALAAGQAERSAHWLAERRRAETELLEAHRQWRLAQRQEDSPVRAGSVEPDLLSMLWPDQALVLFHRVGERMIACVLRRQGGPDLRVDGARAGNAYRPHAVSGQQPALQGEVPAGPSADPA